MNRGLARIMLIIHPLLHQSWQVCFLTHTQIEKIIEPCYEVCFFFFHRQIVLYKRYKRMLSDSDKLFYITMDTTLTIQKLFSMIWYLQPIICKHGYKTMYFSFCHLPVKDLFNERNIFEKSKWIFTKTYLSANDKVKIVQLETN